MFGLGMSEIIFLAVLALIVIGPKQLPEVARTLGRFLNELKRSTNDLSSELRQQTGFDEFNLNKPLARFDEVKKQNQQAAQNQEAPKAEEPTQLELVEQKDPQGNKPS